MASQLSLKYAGAALLFAVCAGISSPAMAGFQWVAPGEPASAPPFGSVQNLSQQPSFEKLPPAAPMAPASRAPSNAPEVISPIVISGSDSKPSPAPQVASKQDVALSGNDVVLGFAKSVPLAVAVRQILPNGYAFSIDQDVDMGTLVSFQGGRAWRETMRDMLSTAGMTMRENGQMVEIGYQHGIAAAAPPPPPMPPPISDGSKYLVPPGGELPVLPMPGAGMSGPDMSMMGGMAAPVPVAEPWVAERGGKLRKILETWCARANVEFNWLSEYDYPIEASVTFNGSFENAVRSLLVGFEGAHPQPIAELHTNPNLGHTVLIVQTRGNPNGD